MTVRCTTSSLRNRGTDREIYDLTVGKTYRVIAIECDDYRIIGDDGRPYIYPKEAFVVIEADFDPDWVVEVEDDCGLYAGPKEFASPGFFEDYFEDQQFAREIVNQYLSAHGFR